MSVPTIRLRHLVLVVLGMLVFGSLGVGCADGDSAGPDTGADMDDVTESDVFGGNAYVGQRVTVSAEVTDVINPTTIVLGGDDYDPLLVLYDKSAENARAGEVVRATGTIKKFHYADYVDTYSLSGQRQLVDFEGEEFLEADTVEVVDDSG